MNRYSNARMQGPGKEALGSDQLVPQQVKAETATA